MIKRIRLQPLVSTSTLSTYGYEALFDINEDLKYPSAVSILSTVFNNKDKGNDCVLCLNVSHEDIADENFDKKFLKEIEILGVCKSNIVLEINESTSPTNVRQAKKMISNLKEQGIKIALDDFGTQYSTLSLMNELPIDIVKFDKDFIKQATFSKKAMTILDSAVKLSHDIGCQAIIEGVETQEQLECAKKVNSDFVQGYFFSTQINKTPFIRLQDFYKIKNNK